MCVYIFVFIYMYVCGRGTYNKLLICTIYIYMYVCIIYIQ